MIKDILIGTTIAASSLAVGAVLSLVFIYNFMIAEATYDCGLEPVEVCDSLGYIYYQSLVTPIPVLPISTSSWVQPFGVVPDDTYTPMHRLQDTHNPQVTAHQMLMERL